MEELETQTYCQRAALELVALITHQRRPRGRQRRDSALLRRFVTEVLSSGGPSAERLQGGPWRVATRPLKKRGRGGLDFIPLVERGRDDDHGVDPAGGGGTGRVPQLLRHGRVHRPLTRPLDPRTRNSYVRRSRPTVKRIPGESR